MKNTKTSGTFIAAFILFALAVVVGIWWAVADAFGTVTHDEFRSDAVATLYAIAIIWFALAILLSDDENTSILSKVLAGLFVGTGIIVLVAVNFYKSVGGNLDRIPELLVWAIPFTWLLPVVIGQLFFIHRSLDKFWGANKPPMVARAKGSPALLAYSILYNVGLVAALIASGLGTFEVMYAITQSAWHALLYVGTVELAIYFFAQFTHRTQDKEIFWYSFGITNFAFVVAMLFQGVNAALALNGGSFDATDTAQTFARNFVLLPPVIMGSIAGAMYIYNQRKTPVLFPNVAHSQTMSSPTHSDMRPSYDQRDSRMGYQPSHSQVSGNPPSSGSSGHPPQRPSGREEYTPGAGKSGQPTYRPQPQGQPQGKQSKHEYAEPGGLDSRETVNKLKALGYSNRAIAGMTQAEADNRIKNQVPPRPDQMSGNYNPNTGSMNKGSQGGSGQSTQQSSRQTNTRQDTPSPEHIEQELNRQFSQNGNGDGDERPNPR